MKKLTFIIPFLLFACGDIENVTPDETFIKFYGDEAFFDVKDMIVVNNDGNEEIVILARRDGEFVGDDGGTIFSGARFYIVHLDASGKLIDQKILPFDLSGISNDTEPSRITATATGYLVIGSHRIGTDPLLIAWAELDGSFEPVGTWNAVGNGTANYVGVDIAEMADGGVLIAGYTDSNGGNDYFYKKIGGTEDEWERTQARPSSDDQLVRALTLDNGNYALVGRTDALSDDGEGGVNVERTIIDADGVIQNSAVYGMTRDGNTMMDDIPSGVIERPNGFTIVGTSSSGEVFPFLMNVDLEGATSTEQLYVDDIWYVDGLESTAGIPVDASITGQAIGVTKTPTNDLMIVGQIDGFDDVGDTRTSNDNGKEMMVFTTDQNGNRKSGIMQFGLVNGSESAIRAASLSDGSVVVVGNYQFGEVLQQIAVLKLNPDGLLKQ